MSTPDAGLPDKAQDKTVPAGDTHDTVDAKTKRLSSEEASQHEDASEAQMTDGEEASGYGH